MKALNLLFLVLLSASAAVAQDSIHKPGSLGAPGLEVISNSWRRVERNLLLEEDPLRVNDRQAKLQRAQVDALETNANLARAKSPQPPVPIPVQYPASPSPRGIVVEYVYEVKVRNTGAKTIRHLTWEYEFPVIGTRRQPRGKQYESKTKIRPGKTEQLVVRTSAPPFGVIDAGKIARMPQGQSPERLVIRRLEYTDGSVWTRPSN